MIQLCSKCNKPIDDGSTVQITVITLYHQISSEKTFALGKPFDYIEDTLKHVNCEKLNGD